MKIRVTPEDSVNASPNPFGCPVARAVGRAINYRASVAVHAEQDGSYSVACGNQKFALPEEVGRKIRNFDKEWFGSGPVGVKFKLPCEFELPL